MGKHAGVNARKDCGKTSLRSAFEGGGKVQAVQLLTDINVNSKMQHFPVHYVQSPEMSKLLLKQSPPENNQVVPRVSRRAVCKGQGWRIAS